MHRSTMRALLTVPLLAVLASAAPKSSHEPFRDSNNGDLNRYRGPTGRPIVFAKKSFFDSDLSVQPSVLYRLVTLPAFATPSFGKRPGPPANLRPVSSNNNNNNDYYNGDTNVRYEDNAIDTERPPNYFKGDSQLYAKKSFGGFGLSAPAGPKPVLGYRRSAHTLQGGYYRPWEALEALTGYESAPRPVAAAYAPYEPFLFAKNQPHQRSDSRL